MSPFAVVAWMDRLVVAWMDRLVVAWMDRFTGAIDQTCQFQGVFWQ